MRPAELAAVLEGTSCSARAVAEHGFHAATCPNADDKLIILERLADRDVKRDPRVRRLALELLRGVPRGPDGRHRPELVARRLHAHVRDTVPYVGEGVETFQPTWTTLKYGGDCDDSARALLALARSVGVPARFDTLERCRRGTCHKTHVAAQLWDGSAWRWAETTIKADLGEHPRAGLIRLRAAGLAPANRPDLGELDLSDLGAIPLAKQVQCSNLKPKIDIDARAAVLDAWGLIVTAPPPTRAALQYVQAVCRLETQYGLGWAFTPGMANLADSNNWGGVQMQKGKTPVVDLPNVPKSRKPTQAEVDASGIVCPPGGALGHDTRSDGSHYAVCFRVYVDAASGCFDVLREIFRRPLTRAALFGTDTNAISAAMYDETYYGGFGKTREERIAGHAASIDCHVAKIAAALGEPIAVRRGGVGPGAAAARALPWVLGAVAVAGVGGGGYYLWKRGRRRGGRR